MRYNIVHSVTIPPTFRWTTVPPSSESKSRLRNKLGRNRRETERTLNTVLVSSSWVDFYQTARRYVPQDTIPNLFTLSLKYWSDVNVVLRSEFVTTCRLVSWRIKPMMNDIAKPKHCKEMNLLITFMWIVLELNQWLHGHSLKWGGGNLVNINIFYFIHTFHKRASLTRLRHCFSFLLFLVHEVFIFHISELIPGASET